jgi:hypothetical protein
MMKYIKLYEEHSHRVFVVAFILDFGMFITMNISKVGTYAMDDKSKTELLNMQAVLNKPILNGQKFSELDLDVVINNPKLLSGLFTQISQLLTYIEPRIERYVKECDNKKNWLVKINDFKERYRKIIDWK